MRYRFMLAALSAAFIVTACADSAAPSADVAAGEQPLFAAGGSQTIPISFVTQFSAFLGGETRTNGNSGRSQSHFCLAFTVQEGDLEGTLETCFSANDPSDQTASQGKNGWFTTTIPGDDHYEVCMQSTGWCGTFDSGTGTGKVYPQPRGVEFNNSLAFGGGDFEGMKLQGSVFECADSQGDRGCFTGHLLVPASR